MDRQIENFIVEVSENNLKNAPWLSNEYNAYKNVLENFDTDKRTVIEANEKICTRYWDKSAYDKYLRENPYKLEL